MNRSEKDIEIKNYIKHFLIAKINQCSSLYGKKYKINKNNVSYYKKLIHDFLKNHTNYGDQLHEIGSKLIMSRIGNPNIVGLSIQDYDNYIKTGDKKKYFTRDFK